MKINISTATVSTKKLDALVLKKQRLQEALREVSSAIQEAKASLKLAAAKVKELPPKAVKKGWR